MLARLGDKIAEPLEHLIADPVPFRCAPLIQHLADARVEIFHLPVGMAFKAQIKGHVVDARTEVVDLFNRHADILRQLLCCPLHAVTQTDSFNLAGAADGPTIHHHRVHILQKGHIGAKRLHVITHVEQHRNRAQPAHNAADTQRIGNGLAQAVFLRNLKIHDRRGLIAADLDHRNCIIGPIQRGLAVEAGFDLGRYT